MVSGLLFIALSAQALEKPAMLPSEEYDKEIGLRATVDGKEVGLALKPFWPDSYLATGTGRPAKIALDGVPLAKVPLKPLRSEELPEGADGVLGQDALRQCTLVFDTVRRTVRVVPQTKISGTRAESLMNDLPSWDGLCRVVRVPLKRTADGVPTVTTQIGDESATLMVRLSFTDTFLDASVTRPPESAPSGSGSYLPKADLGGLTSSWIAYASRDDWAPKEEREGAGGMLALGAFHSRRVIVDLAGDALYVETLSEEARLSLFLLQETSLPILIENGRLVVGSVPGEDDGASSIYPKDSEVVSIAGIAAKEWLEDLRTGTDEAAARMAKRIPLLDHDFAFVVRGADGKNASFTVSRESPPASPSSLPAAGRVRAASRSR